MLFFFYHLSWDFAPGQPFCIRQRRKVERKTQVQKSLDERQAAVSNMFFLGTHFGVQSRVHDFRGWKLESVVVDPGGRGREHADALYTYLI